LKISRVVKTAEICTAEVNYFTYWLTLRMIQNCLKTCWVSDKKTCENKYVSCMISGFCCDVDEICAFQGY
jgi:hypothetical protein